MTTQESLRLADVDPLVLTARARAGQLAGAVFIDDSQGEQNVWYTGATLSHWNIDAITDFNHKLAKR